MPGIREPRRGHRVCEVAGPQTADGSAVSSRRVWNARRRTGAPISVGRGSAERVQGKFRFQIVGSLAGGRASSGSERFRRARSCRERVGVDTDGVRAVSGVYADAILSKLFRKFLRRQTLRDEGRLAAHRSVHAPALFPKLVPTALSVRLRNVPLRRGLISLSTGDPMATPALSLSHRHVSAFAADVRESLTKPGQRELPSKYLYDEVGSALFETICVLPEYGLTRADARLLEKHAGEIVGRLPSPIRVA